MNLTYETFAERRGEQVQLEATQGGSAGGTIAATLAELGELERRAGMVSFSVTFAVTAETTPEQGVYLLSGRDLAPSPIFLVPQHLDAASIVLHAVFNKFAESESAS